MASSIFTASALLASNPQSATLAGLYQAAGQSLPPSPGNVAICLSGGGSRALSAGMGQLLALSMLQQNGQSLLSQAMILSTVSGGSWLGVPFTYLPDSGPSDENFLGGPYVPPAQLTVNGISQLPSGCAATAVTSDFGIATLLGEALGLYFLHNVPAEMLWPVLIGRHLLAPYGIYSLPSGSYLPNSLFALNAAALAKWTTANPPLANLPASLVAASPSRARRPFHICNSSLVLASPEAPDPTTGKMAGCMLPVQTTPLYSGTPGAPRPLAVDQNQFNPGGGQLDSFALDATFSSQPSPASFQINQSRPWTLTDAAGTSSAAFAAALGSLAQEWMARPDLAPAFARPFLEREDMLAAWLDDLVPHYNVFNLASPAPGGNPDPFADGGSLDNSGVLGALVYSDVKSLIVFVNTSTPLSQDAQNNIVVDYSIPPLFGFQPYQRTQGYQSSKPGPNPATPFDFNQVFPSSEFQTLLNGLWSASGQGANSGPAIYPQQLTVQANPWFGIAGGQTVQVLWVVLNPVSAWTNVLPPDVRQKLPSSFPFYNTFTELELPPVNVNLLANLTAWTVFQNSALFQSLFTAS